MNYILLMTGGGDSGGSMTTSLIFFGLFFVILYFFMIRPQTKKAKDAKVFASEIKAGDKIVTISGVHGKIIKVEDDTYMLEIDANTKIRIEKSAVSMDMTRALAARKQQSQSVDTKVEPKKDLKEGN